jgi:hypothetical protein
VLKTILLYKLSKRMKNKNATSLIIENEIFSLNAKSSSLSRALKSFFYVFFIEGSKTKA